jgi:hypothetical protein
VAVRNKRIDWATNNFFLTVAITFYRRVLGYWGLEIVPGDIQWSIVVDDKVKT